MRHLSLALALVLASCATNRLHVLPPDLGPTETALCMAPDGRGLPWVSESGRLDPRTGEVSYTCPAPAFFVRLPRCAPGQPGNLDETPELQAARARLGRDGSLHGDTYEGRIFCVPPSPF